MFPSKFQEVTSAQRRGSLTWELGTFQDKVTYTPPLSEAPQVYTDLTFADFSRDKPFSGQVIHELLHPFGRQLALRFGELYSELHHTSAWKHIELDLFDARVEVLVSGLQQHLFPEIAAAPTVRFLAEDSVGAENRWLQGASALLGAALLQGDDGELRASTIRDALRPSLTALSGSCELSHSGRDRLITVLELPVFSPIQSSTIIAALTEGLHQGVAGRHLKRLGQPSEADFVSDVFFSVYGELSHGIQFLLRDFTDCYPGPQFRSRFRAISLP